MPATNGLWKPLNFLLFFTILLHLLLFAFFLQQPIGARNPFRETQTALSIYWMLQEGPFWAYQTPIFGEPWSIPFEFPLYQWLAAQLSRLSGLHIESAARLISFVSFAAAIAIAAITLERAVPQLADRAVAKVFAVVSSVMVVHLYWVSQVSIETLALLFGVTWLFLMVEAVRTRNRGLIAAAIVAGSVGAAVKAPTMVPYFVLGGVYFISSTYTAWRVNNGDFRWHLWSVTGLIAAGLIPVVVAFVWTGHADQIKSESVFGSWTASTEYQMRRWNFGTIEQRFSLEFWSTIVLRTGPTLIFLAVCIFWLFRKKKFIHIMAVSIFIFIYFLPILMFSNIYFMHDYYHVANQLVLGAGLALAICALWKRGSRAGPSILSGIVVLNMLTFIYAYSPFLEASKHPYVERYSVIGALLHDVSTPDEVVVVFDDTWSSELAYGSSRRVVTVLSTPEAQQTQRQLSWQDALQKIVESPEEIFGSFSVGALAACGSFYRDENFLNKVETVFEGISTRFRDDARHGCRVYSLPER